MKALTTLVAGTTMLAAFALPASAASEHDTLFECYAYVHEQCFPGGKDGGCGSAYDDALDECDDAYDDAGRRPTPPVSLSAPTNPQVRMKIMNSFSGN